MRILLWLAQAYVDTLKRFSGNERIVFLHSWDEWREGTYLEADGRFGRKYLEQSQDAVNLAQQVIKLYRELGANPKAGTLALRLEKEKEEELLEAWR